MRRSPGHVRVQQEFTETWRHWLLFLLIIGGTLAGLAPPSSAQTNTTGSIELVDQSAWVDPGGLFNVQVRVAGASSDSQIQLTVHQAWPDQLTLQDRLVPEMPPVLTLEPLPLDQLQNTSNEILLIELEVVSSLSNTGANDFDGTPILKVDDTEAVYPVEITLIGENGNPTDSLLTNIIVLPRSTSRPPLSTVLLLDDAPAISTEPDGSNLLGSDSIEHLDTLITNLLLHPQSPAAIDIRGELLAALATDPDAQDLITKLRQRLDSEQLLASTYVDVDEQALINAGMQDVLTDSYETSADVATAVLGFAPNPSVTVLDRSIDALGLATLSENGLRGALVEPTHLESLDDELFQVAPYERFLLEAENDVTVPALRIAREFDDSFIGTDRPILDANWLLAELTSIAIAPPLSDVSAAQPRRTIVLAPPTEVHTNLDFFPVFLNVVLNGLERIPALQPTNAHQAMSSTDFVPAEGIGTISPPLRRSLIPASTDPTIDTFRPEHSQAQQAIESWATVIEGDPMSIDRLDNLLLVASATGLGNDQRLSFIESIYRSIDAQKDNALSIPVSAPITVTGQRTEVPLILENHLDVDLSVVVLLDSEKLSFPDGAEVPTRLTPGTNRIDIPVDARASGDSPIRVQILSPDRTVFLASSDVLVRIFAFSGVGLAIGGGAILVLIVWWLRQRRSSPATMPETVREPEGQPA